MIKEVTPILKEDRSPDAVLEGAKGDYKDLMIVGYNEEGRLCIEYSERLLRKDLNWMLDRAKQAILEN